MNFTILGLLSISVYCTVLISPCVNAEEAEPPLLSVAVVGDSTVCNYPEESPRRGWGASLHQYFNDQVVFDNRARGGRSTKTFIQEGRWEKVLKLKPDVVLIQFGHNDSHAPENPESTDAATDYQEYLHQYVVDARRAGIQPVFVTPMPRRYFKKDKVVTSLQKYATAMLRVAQETETPCVDLHAAAESLFNDLGEEGCKHLFAGEDRTHFSQEGADMMAKLIVERITEQDINPLKAYLKTVD